MKISIVTVCLNSEKTILATLNSVLTQSYKNIEHIVVDAQSKDGTLEKIKELSRDGSIIISEPDGGIYDALNKGISRSTGSIIGVLNSDDYFADSNVISEVMREFENPMVDIVYGDLIYISKDPPFKIVRKWRAGLFSKGKMRYGWMPPHPTIFIRRSLLESKYVYDTNYLISADYDFIVRYFYNKEITVKYINKLMVVMRLGGVSNKSLSNIVTKIREDYRIAKNNNIGGVMLVLGKNLRKISQLI
jgi:glycosyltransferase